MHSKSRHSDTASSPSFCFDLSAIFHHPMKIIMHGWNSPTPYHWFSQSGNEILATGTFLQAPGLPLFSLKDDAGHQLWDEVPESILEIIRLVPFLAYEIAQACASSTAAMELAQDCPLLLILAIDYAKRANFSRQAFHTLVCQRRPALLGEMDLPGSQSLSRLLRRITLTSMLPRDLDDVIRTLRTERLHPFLRHHPDVHLNHLLFLGRYRQFLWPGLLFLVDARTRSHDIAWLCRMIRDVMTLANQNENLIRQISSRDALQELHDRLVDRFNQADGEHAEAHRQSLACELEQVHGPYPEPPLPEAEGITALTSWLDLLEEGATMRHCVGSYDVMVASGEVFIYRMDQPERLTIAIRRRGHQWVLSEVRGKRNAYPSEEAMERVQRWLGAFGLEP